MAISKTSLIFSILLLGVLSISLQGCLWEPLSYKFKAVDGVQCDFLCTKRSTALSRAIEANNPDEIEGLIKQGVDLELPAGNHPLYYHTPLYIAVSKKNPNIHIVDLLLKAGAKVNNDSSDDYRATPLIAIANYSKDDKNTLAIIKLLINSGADVNRTDSDGSTALAKAAGSRYQPIELIAFLISSGADINKNDCGSQTTNGYGHTPLHQATLRGNEKAVQFLIKKGATVNIKNCYGDTPLSLAEGRGFTQISALLKAAGAKK
jgi:ankyrin repeat protein